jgi:hypothetical protein
MGQAAAVLRGAPPQIAMCPQTGDRQVASGWIRD